MLLASILAWTSENPANSQTITEKIKEIDTQYNLGEFKTAKHLTAIEISNIRKGEYKKEYEFYDLFILHFINFKIDLSLGEFGAANSNYEKLSLLFENLEGSRNSHDAARIQAAANVTWH